MGEVEQMGCGGLSSRARVAPRPAPSSPQPSERVRVAERQRFPPPADVERLYLDVLRDLEWSKPVVSNATEEPGPVSGPSGVKMRGPYDYVPPSYWLTDTKHGGAFGFATEVGPGAAVPPLDSLKRMLPPEHLWPIDDFWDSMRVGTSSRTSSCSPKRSKLAMEGRPTLPTTQEKRKRLRMRVSERCSKPTAGTSTSPPASSNGC